MIQWIKSLFKVNKNDENIISEIIVDGMTKKLEIDIVNAQYEADQIKIDSIVDKLENTPELFSFTCGYIFRDYCYSDDGNIIIYQNGGIRWNNSGRFLLPPPEKRIKIINLLKIIIERDLVDFKEKFSSKNSTNLDNSKQG